MGSYPKAIQMKDCLLHLGRGQAPAYYDGESNVYAINQKCVRDGAVRIEYARPHDPRKKLKDSSVLQDGDVCINSTGTGTIGRIGLWNEQRRNGDSFFADSHVTIARPDKEIANPKFLASILQSDEYQAIIETHCFSGSTNQVELNKKALGDLSVYLLDKKSQDVVAKILSAVDQAIEQTEAIITKQQRIKTGLMQDLLTKGIDEQGNIRSEETHEFKDSPLGRIPVKWTPRLLRDVGIWKSGGTPSKSEPKYWDGNIPWVCPKDMKCFDLGRTIDTITPLGARTGSKVVPRDTVMIVVRGMILAHTFPVSITRSDMAFNQDIKAIIPFEFISGRFLAYWFYSNGSQLLKIVTTATHGTKRFDTNDLHDVSIAIPDGYEQEKICEIIDQSSLLISQCEEQLFKLQSLNTALMQDLLMGDVSVANLLDEQSTI